MAPKRRLKVLISPGGVKPPEVSDREEEFIAKMLQITKKMRPPFRFHSPAAPLQP